jgi:hypothetical protein
VGAHDPGIGVNVARLPELPPAVERVHFRISGTGWHDESEYEVRVAYDTHEV